MRGLRCAILFCFFCPLFTNGQSYGLRFSSHEVVQEKRTTLNITPTDNLCLRGDIDISFDLMLVPSMEVYFGYVFRLITAEHQNIDLVYNQRLRNFNLIIGDALRGSFTIDSPRMYTGWTNVGLHIDRKGGLVAWSVDRVRKGSTRAVFKEDMCFRMCFGASTFDAFQTADIPPMCIRDLRLSSDGETRYYWPLSESTGNESYDSVQRKVAAVSNPIWIKPLHQNWQQASVTVVSGTPAVAFDASREELYILGADSVYTYSVQKGQGGSTPLSVRAKNLLPGNQAIADPRTGTVYDIDIDAKSVRTYTPGRGGWVGDFPNGPLTEFWQANKFLSYQDSSLYIVGGYGQLHYKNAVQRYSFAARKWETLPAKGDPFTPRYLAGLGTNAIGDTAYIMGGYGSNTGDQMVNPKYDYDLVAYSVRDRSFTTLYRLKEQEEPFCFANSLVIDPVNRDYYGLIFQNDKFNSSLRLIRGSLTTPVMTRLGDSIPYSFYDVKSFADLFYAPQSQKLLAVTMYTNKEDMTEVKVYTIASPPNPYVPSVAPAPRSFPQRAVLWALAGLALVALAVVGVRRRRKKTSGLPSTLVAHAGTAPGAPPTGTPSPAPPAMAPAAPQMGTPFPAPPVMTPAAPPIGTPPQAPPAMAPAAPPLKTAPPPDPRSAVLLFGQFEVYDKDRLELTKLFTPLLKELFLLVLLHTLRSGKGISSEKLYATLWKDKSAKDAQNNRSVNMVKLKGILDKLGSCGIAKEADKWVLHYETGEIRIDLAEFLALVQLSTPGQPDVRRLLAIVHRGAFLSDTIYPWLDDIQSEVSDKAIDFLSAASVRFEGEPEFLLEIAAGIFLFDPVNEDALKMKCKSLSVLGRHSLAKVAFEKFAKEYQQMYGEDFQHSFHEILAN
ncbi:hypothetical protein [Dinghuibacter silviterrae]|uniref:Kelch motif protein n=1 Tax=Dinghuibacter silviterrae TaxID=1539049 RepID=A0A4R8DID9_9BACT|nr:hypothetical protein [Dinghuibacter silviterrae]TDW96926.1 Kelch motif protein [Dinghuibacter silviterrae]